MTAKEKYNWAGISVPVTITIIPPVTSGVDTSWESQNVLYKMQHDTHFHPSAPSLLMHNLSLDLAWTQCSHIVPLQHSALVSGLPPSLCPSCLPTVALPLSPTCLLEDALAFSLLSLSSMLPVNNWEPTNELHLIINDKRFCGWVEYNSNGNTTLCWQSKNVDFTPSANSLVAHKGSKRVVGKDGDLSVA